MADDNRLVAGIELGGTKCIAVMARGSHIIERARFPTETPAVTLETLGHQLETWQAQHGRAEALGIASFGPVALDRTRPNYGHITSTPKPGWVDVDIVGHFARHFQVPIAFDTDVGGAALAEYRWGAAQGCSVLVYLTIGTGVGGGVLVHGAPVHGMIHPELGHIRVRRMAGDQFPGVCPFHGDCLEGLVSGPALAARTGRPGAEVDDDDPVWTSVTDALAEAMAILMLTISPQCILIGGGVLSDRERQFAAIHARTAELLSGYLSNVGAAQLSRIIRPPGLGELAGPLGAVALACRA